MLKKECTVNPVFIEQFADRELSWEESSEIAAHLNDCPLCRSRYEEIMKLKTLFKEVSHAERLTSIERAGLEKMLEAAARPSRPVQILNAIKEFFNPHRLVIGLSATAFGALLTIFAVNLMHIENKSPMVLDEILSLHDSNLPDEIAGKELDQEVEKNLKVPAKMKRLVAGRPVLKARFGQLAAKPAATVSIEDGGARGTLMMTPKNLEVAKVFAKAPCATEVKAEAQKENCPAKREHAEGKDMIHWSRDGADYIFVSENRDMTNRMVQLISAE